MTTATADVTVTVADDICSFSANTEKGRSVLHEDVIIEQAYGAHFFVPSHIAKLELMGCKVDIKDLRGQKICN